MTRNEIQRVLGYLAAAHPTFDLNEATVAVYAESLATVEPAHAMDAACRLVTSEKWFPSVARLLEEVRAVKRKGEPEVKALAQPSMPGGQHLTESRKLLASWKGARHNHFGPNPCPVCGGVRAQKPAAVPFGEEERA